MCSTSPSEGDFLDAILCHYTTVVAEVGFKEPDYRLVEGEDTTVCVTIEGTLEKSVMVNYTLTDVTASGEQYITSNYTISCYHAVTKLVASCGASPRWSVLETLVLSLALDTEQICS